MRDVVIIGGGLTGLTAAYELQKQQVSYMLIEVKPRLGGSIQTVQINDFRLDSGPMSYEVSNPAMLETVLKELALHDAAFVTEAGRLAFSQGAQMLVDALAQRLDAPMMMRMAVSTLGTLDGKTFSICMENGMVLDARALIVTAPARYAERMFHTLTPEISYQLLDYRYDTITRVSAGYRGTQHHNLNVMYPQDSPVMESHKVTAAARVPAEGGAVVQAGLRFSPDELPQDPMGELAALMRWPLNPQADHIATWPESDPANWRLTDHPRMLQTVQQLLPAGVALAGSDYVPANHAPRLDDRIQQGIIAAQRIIRYLNR
jgi:predicted NAD/FAD-dependent oxidoreductase